MLRPYSAHSLLLVSLTRLYNSFRHMNVYIPTHLSSAYRSPLARRNGRGEGVREPRS
jgi:hypothetical protein